MSTTTASSDTMWALSLHGISDQRYERIPKPVAGHGQVLIRVGFCGVCGSDIPRVFSKGTYRFPTVCGHEFAGTVEACGEGVTDLRNGDRVAVFPLLWCGRCRACEQGRYVQCHDYDYLGSRSNGAFAEYVVAPRQNLLPVPDGVSLEEASMTEPAAVALHALRRGGCSVGQTVAIFGAGPIGMMVAQWARVMGASQILLFDIASQKLALAQRLGFKSVHDSRQTPPVQVVEANTAGRGAHLSIDAAGVPQTLVQAISATRHGGRMVILGNHSGDVTLPASLLSQVMRREVDIVGTWNSDYSATGNDDDWRAALAAMAARTIDLGPLVTHRVPLDKAADALLMMKQGTQFYSKVLIHP